MFIKEDRQEKRGAGVVRDHRTCIGREFELEVGDCVTLGR